MSQDSDKDIFVEAEDDVGAGNGADIFAADVSEDMDTAKRAPMTSAPELPATISSSSSGGAVSGGATTMEPAASAAADFTGDGEEEGEQFRLQISVREPEKIGDGMSSYVVYKIHTRTDMPSFHKSEMLVSRRFSDFLGLHQKLVSKHQCRGLILPPAPEKSMVGMTKIKMTKTSEESATQSAFVERRRAELERYLEFVARHPVLREDPDFQQFLEFEGDLPRAYSTQALSGAGVLRLFKNVGDAMGKMTIKMEETDQFSPENQEFEEIQITLDGLERQLTRLLHNCEELVDRRKELALATGAFSQACSLLASAEENTALSRALSQLAEAEDSVQSVHSGQGDSDFANLCVLLKHYIGLIGSIKESMYERVKAYKIHKDAEVSLAKKRETKVKMELSGKMEKIGQTESEIRECEARVDRAKDDFDLISKTLKKEMSFFEKERVRDFKKAMIQSLQDMLANEERMIEFWKSFEPEADSIPA